MYRIHLSPCLLLNMFDYLKSALKNIAEIAGIYILWIGMHFVCANIYPHFCAERTFFGFIKSIFVAETPHCVAMRWVIYNGGNVIHSMWTTLSIWISGKCLTGAMRFVNPLTRNEDPIATGN